MTDFTDDIGKPLAPAPAGAPSDALDELLGGYSGVSAEEAAEQAKREREEASVAAENAATARAAAHAAGAPSARGASSERAAQGAFDSGSGPGLWLLWWIPVVLLPPFGGIAAWYALRWTQRRAAFTMFCVSLAVGFVVALALGGFARPIAAFVTGASRDTVITLPATTAR